LAASTKACTLSAVAPGSAVVLIVTSGSVGIFVRVTVTPGITSVNVFVADLSV
jgi:hypothetical protein